MFICKKYFKYFFKFSNTNKFCFDKLHISIFNNSVTLKILCKKI